MNKSINIPVFLDVKFVNPDGMLTDKARQILEELFFQLQKNFSPEGIFIPSQPTENIVRLDNEKSKNALIVDDTTNELKFSQNGVFKTVQLA